MSVYLQRICRGFVYRVRAMRRAQLLIRKYIPVDGQSYFYNPITRVSSYEKPKILGRYDCLVISMPPQGLEFVIPCNTCMSPAEVNCQQCDESMCKSCFGNLHCKGSRRSHRHEKIPMCSYCRFQMATKTCVTCFMRKPKPGSVQELITEDRGLFCDTCFCFMHDEHEQALQDKPIEEKTAALLVAEQTRQAFLVGQSIHQQVVTTHNFAHMVSQIYST